MHHRVLAFSGMMSLVAAAGSVPTACNTGRGTVNAGDMASSRQDFWGLLDALEHQLPPSKSKLESLLKVSFEERLDWNKRTFFVCERLRSKPFGVAISKMSFHEAAGKAPGDLDVALASPDVSHDEVVSRFPVGHWVPPPPPGYGAPPDMGAAYWVDRPWGTLSFVFRTGAVETVRSVSFALGAHGQHGV